MRARRPPFAPGYGIAADDDGLLPWDWVTQRMAAARNYWLATASPEGVPHAAPVWGLWRDGAFWFGTDPASRKGRNLAANARIAVHLESGDEVVSLDGTAEPVEASGQLLEAYEAKYGISPEASAAAWYSVHPRRAFAWLESDFPRTATRFDP
jgi:pyridoxine/pyridoxamine 5'-phosphate oxidase